MDALVTADVFLFEAFRFDRRAGGLFRRDDGGALVPGAIGSRALAVLDILIVRQGDLVSKDEIMQTVWPGTVVEDNNLTVQISALRRVLDQGRAEGSCIQTVAGRGYRFLAPVRPADPPSAPGAAPLSGNGSAEPVGAGNGQAHRPPEPVWLRSPPPAPWRAKPRLWAGIIAAGLVAVGLVVAVIAGEHWPWRGNTLPAPRLSIVVLPFADLSVARDQQYFADGVTEDLTTDLSRMAGTFVISADTALTYRTKPVDAKQIGRELGVRYVVEGSLERSGNRVRVNAQLIDAETDTHLWAEHFDRDIDDLFELQSEITGRIAFRLGLELVAAEANRPVAHPDALDYIFRGREFFFNRPPSRATFDEAIRLYDRALALDPRSAEAKTWLAGALVNEVTQAFTASRLEALDRAEKLIDEALATNVGIPWAHYVKGTVLRAKGQWQDAVPEFEAALALNPNSTGPLQGLGWCKLFTGSLDQVIPLAEKAIRIGPRDPSIGYRFYMIGMVHELRAEPAEAIVWFEKARGTIAAAPGLWTHLAAAHALRGDLADAAADLAEARRLSPEDRYSSISRLKTFGPWGVPKVEAMFEATYFAGLRKAGMAEE